MKKVNEKNKTFTKRGNIYLPNSNSKPFLTRERRGGKSLWDWLVLLVSPAIIATVAGFITSVPINTQTQVLEETRQTEALSYYMERITEITQKVSKLSENNRSVYEQEIQSRTSIILQSIDINKKGEVIKFLYKNKLINGENPTVLLKGLDLTYINLSDADIPNINLSGTNLSYANLRATNLRSSFLENSKLINANLEQVKLDQANLYQTSMKGANLSKANFIGANLSFSNLSGVYLDGANFSGAYLDEMSPEKIKNSILNKISKKPQIQSKVTFKCIIVSDVPTTVAITSKEKLPIIVWQSNAFLQAGYSPERRCKITSKKFQDLYKIGQFSYLSTGVINNIPAICAAGNTKEVCTENNVLFYLSQKDDPQSVLLHLLRLRDLADVGPIRQ